MGAGPDGVDYSWARPNPAALAQAGIKLVARYLSHDDSKDISATEAAALHAAGIGVLANWESQPGRPLLGAAAGTQDGTDAAAKAELVGFPHGCCIYYSCDTDTNQSQWPTIAAYYKAAGAATNGRYTVGVYGEADLIEYLHNAGVVTSEWQTYAWSNGRLSAEADFYQYLNGQTVAGASVDLDRIIHPDLLGAWWPENSPYGENMPTADEIAAAVWNAQIRGHGTAGAPATTASHAASDWLIGTKASVGAVQAAAAGAVDVNALADALVAAGIGQAVVTALGQKLGTPS